MDEPRNDVALLRKASFTFWLLAVLMLLIAALIGFSLFGPNPSIEIGKATTRITTPLNANGLPDYAAVLLTDSRKGVTPENNGAVPFLMAMWPEEKVSDDIYSDGFTSEEANLICTELGLQGVPPVELRVTSLHTDKNRLAVLRLLRERLPKPEGLSETAIEEIDPDDESLWGMGGPGGGMGDEEFFNGAEADAVKNSRVQDFLWECEPVNRVWTAEELPFLAKWLEENNAAIDLIVKGAERPEWYFPSPGLLRGGNGSLMNSLGNVHILRSAARLLTTRSSFYLGKGLHDESIQDALAILRLAHHASKGPFYVDQLVASAIGGIGLRTVDRIATDKTVPAETLRSLLKEFDSIGPFSRVAYTTDRGERFFVLDMIVASSATNDFRETPLPEIVSVISCDWNPALRTYNDYYDAAVAATQLPTWTGRQTAYEQVEATVTNINFPPQTANEWFGILTARGRGKILSDLLLAQNGAWIQTVFRAEDRSITNRQLTRLGIALAIHHAEQGAYPQTVDELVPGVLQKLPVDLFHDNPFVYRKTDDGFLLYSLGANGADEEGNNQGEGWGESKLKGVGVKEPEYDDSVAADWDENGECIGESMGDEGVEENNDDPFAKIPDGADDLSLRVPLPAPEPWLWETAP